MTSLYVITLLPYVLAQNCSFFKHGPHLDVQDLVGNWISVYRQPKAIDCFALHIRATTDLEREQYIMKYSNFSDRVDWNKCLLEVESPIGKHFLQGNGTGGLLQNIIVLEEKGKYKLQEQSADQWSVYGRRGSEMVVMRDCSGDAAAAFTRAPYWPTSTEVYSILHRSGIATHTHGKALCQLMEVSTRQAVGGNFFGQH